MIEHADLRRFHRQLQLLGTARSFLLGFAACGDIGCKEDGSDALPPVKEGGNGAGGIHATAILAGELPDEIARGLAQDCGAVYLALFKRHWAAVGIALMQGVKKGMSEYFLIGKKEYPSCLGILVNDARRRIRNEDGIGGMFGYADIKRLYGFHLKSTHALYFKSDSTCHQVSEFDRSWQ
nr:hypothetical protein [Noviherbaspirillum malthae]